MPEPKKSSNNNFFYHLQRYLILSSPAASASYTIIGAVTVLSFIGYYLDKRFETLPLLTLLGLIIGLIIGFYELAKTLWVK
tara:strand:+ start:2478 stop:2720 length:243 start_codon:yes stop_codon:yes gene_type:complete